MTEPVTAIHRIFFYISYSSDSSRADAQALLDNLAMIPDRTIEETAELCYTNPATLSRLVRKLGYSGWTEFRSAVKYAIAGTSIFNRSLPFSVVGVVEKRSNPYAYIDYLGEILSYCRENIDPGELDEICEQIYNKKTVYLFSSLNINYCAVLMAYDFVVTGHRFIHSSTTENVLEVCGSLTDEDFVIYCNQSLLISRLEEKQILDTIIRKGAGCLLLAETGDPLLLYYHGSSFVYPGSQCMVDYYYYQIYINMLMIRYRRLFIDPRT